MLTADQKAANVRKNAAAVASMLEKIITQVNGGEPMPAAFDAVMGAGAYEKLAGEVWETLRAK